MRLKLELNESIEGLKVYDVAFKITATKNETLEDLENARNKLIDCIEKNTNWNCCGCPEDSEYEGKIELHDSFAVNADDKYCTKKEAIEDLKYYYKKAKSEIKRALVCSR